MARRRSSPPPPPLGPVKRPVAIAIGIRPVRGNSSPPRLPSAAAHAEQARQHARLAAHHSEQAAKLARAGRAEPYVFALAVLGEPPKEGAPSRTVQ